MASKLGVSPEELKEMMKPFILLIHRHKLPYITITLEGTIGKINTEMPPKQ